MKKTWPTFSLVTDEAVRGMCGNLAIHADKIPAMRHGMEQWKLQFGTNGPSKVILCNSGHGAEQTKTILRESAPYWVQNWFSYC